MVQCRFKANYVEFQRSIFTGELAKRISKTTSDMINTCLSFGRVDLLLLTCGDSFSIEYGNNALETAVVAAIESERLEPVQFVKNSLCVTSFSYFQEICTKEGQKRLSKCLLEYFGIPIPNMNSKLSSLSYTFPVFNESIEVPWCQKWRPRKNTGTPFTPPDQIGTIYVISMKDHILPNVLEFCCLSSFINQKKQVLLADIPYTKCIHDNQRE